MEAVAEEQVVEQQEANPTEERARSMGWVPQDEFRGAPEKWRDAEAFLRRGEQELPILRERYSKVERELQEVRKTLKEFSDYHKQVSAREYDKALKTLKKEQLKAVEEGDTDRYRAVEQDIAELHKTQPRAPQVQPQDTELDGWITENPWYNSDQELASYAFAMGEFLARAKPQLQGRAQLDEISRMVKKEFPDKFSNPKRSTPAAVHGGESYASGKASNGKRTYADLPAEAKAACDRFVKLGVLTKDQYVKEYEWE